jgi:hypothetical protein
MSALALGISLAVFAYGNRAASVRPYVAEICLGPKGVLLPITFSNDGARVGLVEDVFLTVADTTGAVQTLIPTVVLKQDHIPFAGTKGHRDVDDIQGTFGAFAVPPESSVTQTILFAAADGKNHQLPLQDNVINVSAAVGSVKSTTTATIRVIAGMGTRTYDCTNTSEMSRLRPEVSTNH